MDGLLLRLLDDKRGSPGRCFWSCFEPLRATFDRHYWIFPNQPWMGAPAAFDYERESADYEGMGETSVCLWRPGAVGRWADQFCEEQIELWATSAAAEPARLASEFRRTFSKRADAFIEKHAELWLIYCDSTCWEVFARDASVLRKVREYLQGNAVVGVYDNTSKDRSHAYSKAGIGEVWRAMHGQTN